jgi:hypothetical protein
MITVHEESTRRLSRNIALNRNKTQLIKDDFHMIKMSKQNAGFYGS